MSTKTNVGIFDSGIGGLTVANSLIQQYPDIDFCYLADSLFLPYGTQKSSVVKDRVQAMLAYFEMRGFSLVICACNTAYALGREQIKDSALEVWNVTEGLINRLPFDIDMRKSLLIATPNTIKSGVYQDMLGKIYRISDLHITAHAELVKLIEYQLGKEKIEEAIDSIKRSIDFTPENVLLGCTHYNWVKELFEKTFPKSRVFSSEDVFTIQTSNKAHTNRRRLEFLDTGNSQSLKRLVQKMFNETVELISLEHPSLK